MRNVKRDREALRIFAEACALPASDRSDAVERACAGDDVLLNRVRRMLAADSDSTGPIATEAKVDRFIADQARLIDPDIDLDAESDSPEVEGCYTILRVIGEGGMGTVYEAEQHQPRRRVAIKAIRPGRITPQMRKRFDYEAQVLGRLEHVGIARLYEADTQSEDGRVRAFLAMELVIGEPIDVYADQHHLDVRDRLRLFSKVCDAVAYAHRMGVIHRDIKPANILVNAEGQPKVLDFGVARTVGDDKLLPTLLTEHGQIIGTLAYMSPEQVEGNPGIDTRSDVYSLGVLLFKLLAGVLPIELGNAGLIAATHRLLHETPRRLGDVDRRLKGDLELIVATALEKDRSRRYASVEQLCAELDRFATGRPIEARGDSALYLVRKTIWRHRSLVGVVALLIGLLAAFGIYASVAAERNRQLAVDAERARDAAIDSETRATTQAATVRRSLYFSSIGFAQSAMENNDIERVHALLDGCEPELRGWEWSYLKRMCDLSSETRNLKMDQPRYATFSRDRSLVAYVSLQREALLLETATGRERFRTKLATGTARAAISGDGKHLVVGGLVDGMRLIDVETLAERLLPVTPSPGSDSFTKSLRVMAFSDDDKLLVTAGLDRMLRVWNVADATQRHSIDLGEALPLCMAILPGSRVAVIGDNRGGLRAFDLEAGQFLRSFAGHDAPVWSLAVSHDGQWLASGDNDARLIVREIATGNIVTQLDTNDGWITAIAFNGDRSMLALGRADSTIRLLHLPDASNSGVLRGHRHAIIHVAFEDDGTLRSASIDGTSKTWLPETTRGVPTIDFGEGETVALAFARSEKRIFVGGGDGSVRSWGIEGTDAGRPAIEGARLSNHASTVLEIAVHPRDPKIVCTSSRDGTVRVSDATTGLPIRVVTQVVGAVPSLAFSPDGSRILVGSASGISIFDADTAAVVGTYATAGYIANEARFDGTGNGFYAACSDGRVRRWEVSRADAVAEAAIDSAGLYDVAISPDGSTVAASGDTGSVALLDAKALTLIRRFTGHQGPVTGVAFHPGGQRLATCGNDRSIRIWDLEFGTQLIALRGHRRIVQQLEFSADGAVLGSTSDDGTVRLWKGPVEQLTPTSLRAGG